MGYDSIYRARAVKYEPPVVTAFVPQVFGETPIEIIDAIGSPSTGMGWVFFQGGSPEHPVWSSGVGGGGTVTDVVWTGPDAPADPSIELWYDTDEVAQYATSADHWNSEWGTVAYAQVVANQTGITTVADLTGLAVTFTATAGRRYRATGYAFITSTVANDTAGVLLTNAANTQLQQVNCQLSTIAAYGDHVTLTYVSPSISGATTWKLRMVRAAGTGSFTNVAGAINPSFILVEDIGPINRVASNDIPPATDWTPFDQRYVNSDGDALTGHLTLPSTDPPGTYSAVHHDWMMRWINLVVAEQPQGIVAYAQTTTTQGSITTVVDLTGLSVTFTAVAGRHYKVTGRGWPSSTVVTDAVYMPLCNAANTQLQNASCIANGFSLHLAAVLTGLSGSTTLKLRMNRSVGTGTVSNIANSTTPSFICVEDLGVL